MDLQAFADSGQFQEYKLFLLEYTGLARDALHVHIGLAVFVLARLLWRWNGGWMVAWLAALAAALGGEWLDLGGEIARSDIQTDSAHWHDIWNTMLWPTILLFVGRWLHPRPKPAPETANDEEESGDLADEPFEQAPPV